MIKVLVVPVAEPPRVIEIAADDLKGMQDLVEGYLEVVAIPGAVLWVNEDGLLRQMPRNPVACQLSGRVIVGPAFVTGPADSDGVATTVPTFYERLGA